MSTDLDPPMVLAVLAGDAERVAVSLPTAGDDAGLAIAAGCVVVDLAYRAVGEGRAHLRAAYQAFTSHQRVPTPPRQP